MPRIRHHVLNQVRHLSCARNIVPQRRVFWYSPLHSQWARQEWLLWKDKLRGKKSQAYTHNAEAYTLRRHPAACPIPSDPSDTWHISAPMIGGTDSEALGCKTIENDPAPPLDTPAPAPAAPPAPTLPASRGAAELRVCVVASFRCTVGSDTSCWQTHVHTHQHTYITHGGRQQHTWWQGVPNSLRTTTQ